MVGRIAVPAEGSPVAVSPACVVLDDDPTGVQTLAGIRVLLRWDADRIARALDGRPSVHLITNTRALPPRDVGGVVAEAARAALSGAPGCQVVLRGDSTLRGHLLEEYLAVRDVVAPERWPVHLVVPSLPSAGRITRDGVFTYSSARLLDWAEERSGGLFPARAGRELPLDELRSGGGDAVCEALAMVAAAGRPAVLAPDAETSDDLALVAAGLRSATQTGVPVIVRCAPAFAGVLTGTAAVEPAPLPITPEPVLVVCGSYVTQTTRQLEALAAAYHGTMVEVDVGALVGPDAAAEVVRVAAAASRRLAGGELAVIVTPRQRAAQTSSLEMGERIAAGVAEAVGRVDPRPSVIVAKGGITSAVTLRDGVGVDEAEVVGPVEPGVSRWSVVWPDGRPLDYLVVPGNVGDTDLLVRLVSGIMRGSAG